MELIAGEAMQCQLRKLLRQIGFANNPQGLTIETILLKEKFLFMNFFRMKFCSQKYFNTSSLFWLFHPGLDNAG